MRLHPRGQPASRSACETDLAECAEWISFGSRSSSHDPVALRRWWAEALGWVLVAHAADEFEIRPTPDRVPGLLFVPVPEEKAGKNRLHPDFRPVDQTQKSNVSFPSVLGGPMSGSVTRRGWYSPTLKAMSLHP
jgi:glyoxalase superfamily protein